MPRKRPICRGPRGGVLDDVPGSTCPGAAGDLHRPQHVGNPRTTRALAAGSRGGSRPRLPAQHPFCSPVCVPLLHHISRSAVDRRRGELRSAPTILPSWSPCSSHGRATYCVRKGGGVVLRMFLPGSRSLKHGSASISSSGKRWPHSACRGRFRPWPLRFRTGALDGPRARAKPPRCGGPLDEMVTAACLTEETTTPGAPPRSATTHADAPRAQC